MSTKKAAKKSARKKPTPAKTARKAPKQKLNKPAKKPAAKQPSSKAAVSSADSGGPGQFNWNELMTSDAAAATVFYTSLFSWTTRPFGEGMEYTILQNSGKGIGGLMQAPTADMPAMWLAYVTVPDIDETVAKLEQLGGTVCKPPFAIPSVGRIAIVQDPQGATFGLHSC